MLKAWQVAVLTLLGAAMWAFVTWRMHSHPEAALATKDWRMMFATAPLAGAFSVLLCKLAGRLSTEQLLPGVAVVGAVAMLMDGFALRWSPWIYGQDEKALRLGAADLLWGYGVGFAAALVWWAIARGRERARAATS